MHASTVVNNSIIHVVLTNETLLQAASSLFVVLDLVSSKSYHICSHCGDTTAFSISIKSQAALQTKEKAKDARKNINITMDGLRSFPTELLIMTFQTFIPEPLPTLPTPLDGEHMWKRSTLLALCLVSKRLRNIAQPLLFRTLTITSGKQVVPLFQVLWNDPVLRQYPRSFACPILLKDSGVVDSVADR